MEDIKKKLESRNCKILASHVRNFGGGWYEQYFPLQLGDISSYGPPEQIMIENSVKELKKSQAKYSKFCVGACILGIDSVMYTGFNIEIGNGIHAEEAAIVAMLKGNTPNIMAMAIAKYSDNKENFPMPCGECRQKIYELAAGNAPIMGIKVNSENKIWQIDHTNIEYLLPKALGNNNLALKGSKARE